MRPAEARTISSIAVDWNVLHGPASRANRAIARFDGAMLHLKNADLLTTPLTTREAVLSSRIEGTVVTVGEVFRFEAGDDVLKESRRLDVEEIVNYRVAMRRAVAHLEHRPFGYNLLLELHRLLLDSVRGSDKAPGQFRRVQNHIGCPGSTLAQADFVPPSPESLPASLAEWERYYHSDEADALVQLAILHAQFEFLHPFLDGNGRIGRILIPLFLYEREILKSPSFYLSEYLEEHRDSYIDHLRRLDEGNQAWTRWCAFFLRAIEIQAQRNLDRITQILELYDRVKELLIEHSTSRSNIPLLDAMYRQPIFQATSLLDLPGIPRRPQLLRQLTLLVDLKILKLIAPARGRRAALYSFHDLVALCESNSAKPGTPRMRRDAAK